MSKISKKRIKNTSQTILFRFYSFFAIFFIGIGAKKFSGQKKSEQAIVHLRNQLQ